jgi:alanine racemase
MYKMETPLSYAEVSASALVGNYRVFREMIPSDVKMLTLMKANAYGHGAVWAAKLLEREGADCFGIATDEEALELRRAGIRTPLLILGYTRPERIPELARADVTQALPDLDAARSYSDALKGTGLTLRAHIKLDTGMARYGLDCRDTDAAVRDAVAMAKLPHLNVEGMFTHFATADSAKDAYTPIQAEKFSNVYKKVTNAGVKIEIAHCENSAAMLKYKGLQFNMVRLGISLYGIAPSLEIEIPESLRTVMALHTTIVQVKTLKAGESVSYGRRFITERPTKLAVVRIGYGDGLPRALTNKGVMSVRGVTVPMVGTVCMDACMLDVTDVPGVERGDDVLVFGRSGDLFLSPDTQAAACGTIAYELVTRIGSRIPRIAVE